MNKIFGIVFFLLLCQSVSGANLPDFPFVVSVGSSEQDVKPNIATIQLGVMAFEKDSDLALKTVNLASTSVIGVLKKYGVPVGNVEASDIEKSTKRKRDSDYNTLDVLGYEVSRSITVKLENLSKYSELMSDLVAINNVSGARTAFDISNRKEIEAKLMETASKDARDKAEKMAISLGTKIQSVYAISQASNFSEFFATFGARSEQIMADMAYREGSYNTVMFVPKSINVKQGVNVVFRIK
ncbi:SIMPL domain-containing protein [Saccharophagus degradans]|uniref:DUF541 domain-containing protein n=1 Tax=Saccharophagus degradans (strain 2-40 / ATCC 43961 / DSM 17024) TaxID=203122 RepID=Q21G33_SACD2|nr:SIMPL domain-containing protein [Saccharophagus degradans]ABD82346.1 protein of unknown function DUF541 [Saccharophagus degradans 2-40]